jgi:cysteine desulfuration protein SufE
MTVEELIENFAFLGEWEDRYRYLIDLGRKLPDFPETDKTDANKVEGCMSQVWMTGALTDDAPARLELRADSDAAIVRGLIAVLLTIYSGRTPEEIKTTDIEAIFHELELEGHISPNRRNGFYAMVQRIKTFANLAGNDQTASPANTGQA